MAVQTEDLSVRRAWTVSFAPLHALQSLIALTAGVGRIRTSRISVRSGHWKIVYELLLITHCGRPAGLLQWPTKLRSSPKPDSGM